MSDIRTELKSQIEENINIHQDIIKMSKDIIYVIENIEKKLRKVGKLLFCRNGGKAKKICDKPIIICSNNIVRIQE